ncbi:MAG: DUF92 domain-containing protein [Acidobacteria bacterium]|uniref:DUF92 domain-containing protein n=1 Tax=Candidatus Polarisedimenticola svalbardensis TaxID=2886004 RepID=A0A8J6Y6E0_9BACT|nr:DUF92 domain-containing protein [Candidatus Polarisedimenticola svalbardensis]
MSVRSELLRKLVHVGMGGFALALRWLTPWQAAACALIALLFNLLLLHRITGRSLLRSDEKGKGFSLGIALYPAVVLTLVLVFFRRLELAAAVWGFLAFGDGMATVAGVTVGGPKLPWNGEKSWAGLVSFVLWGTAAAAFLIRWVQQGAAAGQNDHVGMSFLTVGPWFLLAGCFAAALAAALAESARTGIDDNILVPLAGGLTLFAATLVDPAVLAASWPTMATALLWGAAINAVLAMGAYAAKGVGVSGAVWGWVLGTLLYGFGGWRSFLMLLVFFVLGTACTKAGYGRKAALGIAQEKGGRRGARNAFANTSAGVLFAFLAVATPYSLAFSLAVVAAFATAASDTVSSEIGQAYGKRHFLVTTFRRVPAGTDGAVSLEGTLAGIGASLVLGAVAAWTGLIPTAGIGLVALAAFVGTTLESYLGAAFEQTKQIDNELVNFTNTLAGGLTALALAWLVF